MKRILFQSLLALALLPVAWASPAQEDPGTRNPEDFTGNYIRFTETGKGEGLVETALKSFSKPDGTLVTLIGVIHVADASYFTIMERLFEEYDAVLYEMIRDDSVDPSQAGESDHPVSLMQKGMRSMLGLEFQLDAIDYSRTNFVHADLDPASFAALQEERGESLFGVLLKASLEERDRQLTGQSEAVNPFQMLFALTQDDSEHRLKFLLGKQMSQMDAVLASVDETPDGQGSVLLSGRNDKALEVLGRELDAGKKKLAIFYGAGHMTDMEEKLEAMGFAQVSERWLIAWDIRRQSR